MASTRTCRSTQSKTCSRTSLWSPCWPSEVARWASIKICMMALIRLFGANVVLRIENSLAAQGCRDRIQHRHDHQTASSNIFDRLRPTHSSNRWSTLRSHPTPAWPRGRRLPWLPCHAEMVHEIEWVGWRKLWQRLSGKGYEEPATGRGHRVTRISVQLISRPPTRAGCCNLRTGSVWIAFLPWLSWLHIRLCKVQFVILGTCRTW